MGSFQRDTTIAISIETLQELDDTLVHRKLAILLKTGRNRVKRVMHTYGLAARRKRQKYIYPGKAAQTAPNVVRELEPDSQQHVVFSDIFEVRLADHSRVRADLVTSVIETLTFPTAGAQAMPGDWSLLRVSWQQGDQREHGFEQGGR